MKKTLGVTLLLIPWVFLGVWFYGDIPPQYNVLYMLLGGVVAGVSIPFGIILAARKRKVV